MPIKKIIFRIAYFTVFLLTVVSLIGIGVLLESKKRVFNTSPVSVSTPTTEEAEPFPVGVNVKNKLITENPEAEIFFTKTLAKSDLDGQAWWDKLVAVLSRHDWYQNLASPVSRIVVIWPGERKEEIAKNIGDILRWDNDQRLEFQLLTESTQPIIPEGKYFPGKYVAHREATPEEIYSLIQNSFQTEVLNRYTAEVAQQVPLEDALIVASLIEREASDFTNMREVSGVIWNRLFIDMRLQLDATLQYARTSNHSTQNWWPKVNPADKFVESAYNTYRHKGLPPAPIANPSIEAILAALNPIQTECLYYFHTQQGEYYCSETYEEHVTKLKSLYGRGS
jgi:uncharacterized YceG family protein